MALRPYQFAREWIKLGHDVLVVSGSWSHLRNRQPSPPAFIAADSVVEGVPFRFLRVPSYRGNGLKRILNIAVFACLLQTQVRLLSRWNPDIVIASSTHPFDIKAALRIARRSGASFVWEVHDLWPMTPMLLGGYSARNPYIKMMQRREDLACKRADMVVSILPGTKTYLQGRGLSSKRWAHVPNCADMELTMSDGDQQAAYPIIQAVRAAHGTVIGYLGGHNLSNCLYDFLDSVERLNRSDLHVVLVGDGREKESLQKRFGHLRNVHWYGPISRNAARNVMEHCDFLFIGFHDSRLYDLQGVSPNKFFDYCASGRPVLVSGPPSANLVAEIGNGIWRPAGSPKAMDTLLLEALTLSVQERDGFGSAGRNWVSSYANVSIQARRFLDLKALISQP